MEVRFVTVSYTHLDVYKRQASLKVVGDGRDLRAAQRHREAQSQKQAADAAAEGEPPGRHAVGIGHLYGPDGGGAADESAEQYSSDSRRAGLSPAKAVVFFTGAPAADNDTRSNKEGE